MTKSNIIHSKKKHNIIIHYLHKTLTDDIQRNYGLSIFSCMDRYRSIKKLFDPRCFEFYCISHFLDGDCLYWTEKRGTVKLDKEQGIITTPGFIHCYGGVKHDYIEDSICFTGKIADALFETGIIRNGIIQIGDTRRLLPIIELAADPAKKSQIKANITLQQLILDLHSENQIHSNGKNYSKVSKLKEELLKHPERWWTVDGMADFCNLGKMQFHRIFKAETGMSPKQYIDNLKIQEAIKYLSQTNCSMVEIAKLLGYRDSFHFSRRFKIIVEMPPTHYRQKFQQK